MEMVVSYMEIREKRHAFSLGFDLDGSEDSLINKIHSKIPIWGIFTHHWLKLEACYTNALTLIRSRKRKRKNLDFNEEIS